MSFVRMLSPLVALIISAWSFLQAPTPRHPAPEAATGVSRLDFSPLDVPLAPEAQRELRTATSVSDLETGATYPVGFTELMRSGREDNSEIFGGLKDAQERPLRFPDGTHYVCSGTNAVPGAGPDFFSILDDPDGSGKRYMVTQFECAIGAYYVNAIAQDAAGTLKAVPGTLRYVGQQAYHGGRNHCAGSKTPWESHLGSEEYEADARIIGQYRRADGTTGFADFDETAKFFGGDAWQADPYYWGWVTEVQLEAGVPDYRKHYAMGRFSHEVAYVMPDDRSVYMSDDGTNGGLYLFVADHASNLNSGTLYAARWRQRSTYEGGGADLEWISLGHACEAEIRRALEARPAFSDLFESEAPHEDGSCPTEGFAPVNSAGRTECLKLRRGRYSEAAVSRLESRRYAALMGATTEFRKEEGITYDPDHRRLYVAISEVGRGMRDGDGEFDAGGPNDIALEENGCGAVYALNIADAPRNDSRGKRIDSAYVAADMEAILTGRPKTYAPDDPYAGNMCDVGGIANPDNLTYLPGGNLLVIGEDSKNHRNNVLWGYDVVSGTLQRIATLPLGAEATAPYWYGDLGGYGYLSLTVQHPEGEASYTGVIGPFRPLR